MKVIDAHHHLWRQADLPWLQGPLQPRVLGGVAAVPHDNPARLYRIQ